MKTLKNWSQHCLTAKNDNQINIQFLMLKQDEFTLAINNPENEEVIVYEAQFRVGPAWKAQQEIQNTNDESVQKYVIYSKFPVQVIALPASHQPDNHNPKTSSGSKLDE